MTHASYPFLIAAVNECAVSPSQAADLRNLELSKKKLLNLAKVHPAPCPAFPPHTTQKDALKDTAQKCRGGESFARARSPPAHHPLPPLLLPLPVALPYSPSLLLNESMRLPPPGHRPDRAVGC